MHTTQEFFRTYSFVDEVASHRHHASHLLSIATTVHSTS